MDASKALRIINGLIAKAEGTDNEIEAATFMAKAQQMMIDMAISSAELREAKSATDGPAEKPVLFDFEYSPSDSNAAGKRSLLHEIARASRLRMINYPMRRGEAIRRFGATNVASQWCGLVGYQSDIDGVLVMYASLLIQGFRFGAIDFKSGTSFGVKKSRFMTSYLMGFGATVGERMRAMNEEQKVTTNALIVRTQENVNEAFSDFFPNTRRGNSRVKASGAYFAGQAGGQRADIGRPSVSGSARRQIGG